MLLENKNIIILGGSGSIGQAAIKAFIEQGAKVIVMDLHAGDDPVMLHSDVHFIQTDATSETDIIHAFNASEDLLGTIHGLYHIAGGSGRRFGDGPLHELTLEGWTQTLNLNLTSVMLSNRSMIQYWLKKQCSGSIVNVGSVLASSPAPHFFTTHAYTASKAGIEGFSKSIAAYYSAHNIRVNVIAPGLVATRMSVRAQENQAIMDYIKTKQPLDGGRIGWPDDCTGAAVYLLSDWSRFVTGQVLTVDGGWSLNEGQW